MKSNNFWLAIPLALVLAGPAAVAQTSTTQTKAPEAGANSFTEAQAKDRIKKAGFSQVSGLRKDDQGIWRASATKGRCKGQCVCRFPRQRHNPVRSQNMARTVSRLYDTYGDAQRAVSGLEDAGFSTSEIGMVSRYRDDETLADTASGSSQFPASARW
jgi:hypothetical protein